MFSAVPSSQNRKTTTYVETYHPEGAAITFGFEVDDDEDACNFDDDDIPSIQVDVDISLTRVANIPF
jgi:hypothetical protein